MPEKSILDMRLAEIDRRLQTIQAGLAPAVEAARGGPVPEPPVSVAEPPLIVPEAAPVPQRLSDAAGQEFAPAPDRREMRRLEARLRELVEAHESLLASARDLVGGARVTAPGAPLSMSAGPFADTGGLRRFVATLETLPEVQRVSVREYEGADRAVIDVHLAPPTP
jgi:hypothetical protein